MPPACAPRLREGGTEDPWGGNTLEWATTSPPPPYNFVKVPVVRSFMPMRELRAELNGRAPVADRETAPAPTSS